MLIHGRSVMIHAARLAPRKVANSRRKTRVCDEMRRARQGRDESPRHLVLALRARLEALQLVFDAILDSLVVAGLEMQAVVVAAGAPVAAEQCVLAHEEYCH